MSGHTIQGTLACLALGLLLGCGSNGGPTRHQISGTVSYAGKPVPRGRVEFEPDTSKGNSGPGAMAEIQKGKFQTLANAGAVTGPHIVHITGSDGIPFETEEGITLEQGQPLFSPYTTTADIVADGTPLILEVPRTEEP